ncbi:hypothetical protein MO973_11650 [Paenibacillus sp. TRM 82003]|nr:hypothetical protein [Paenibacillus sp. TRM 82003]
MKRRLALTMYGAVCVAVLLFGGAWYGEYVSALQREFRYPPLLLSFLLYASAGALIGSFRLAAELGRGRTLRIDWGAAGFAMTFLYLAGFPFLYFSKMYWLTITWRPMRDFILNQSELWVFLFGFFLANLIRAEQRGSEGVGHRIAEADETERQLEQ